VARTLHVRVAKRREVKVVNLQSAKALAENSENLLCPAYAGHPEAIASGPPHVARLLDSLEFSDT
jgi:hypothetical protein